MHIANWQKSELPPARRLPSAATHHRLCFAAQMATKKERNRNNRRWVEDWLRQAPDATKAQLIAVGQTGDRKKFSNAVKQALQAAGGDPSVANCLDCGHRAAQVYDTLCAAQSCAPPSPPPVQTGPTSGPAAPPLHHGFQGLYPQNTPDRTGAVPPRGNDRRTWGWAEVWVWDRTLRREVQAVVEAVLGPCPAGAHWQDFHLTLAHKKDRGGPQALKELAHYEGQAVACVVDALGARPDRGLAAARVVEVSGVAHLLPECRRAPLHLTLWNASQVDVLEGRALVQSGHGLVPLPAPLLVAGVVRMRTN